jgi:hypothetical protein
MTDHIPGHPMSRSTYERHGCRCDMCTLSEETHREVVNSEKRAIRKKRKEIELKLAAGESVTAIMSNLGVPYYIVKSVLKTIG